MKSFSLSKEFKYKKTNKFTLENGYIFNNKINITLYNKYIINSILLKKIKSSFNKLIILLESGEDDTSLILTKIDALKNLLVIDYYPYIDKDKLKIYLLKLSKLEKKVINKKNKKR